MLSKAECFEVAHIDAILTASHSKRLCNSYLHKLNILFYYEDVLPGVIFCDPQVLYRLKTDPSEGTPTKGNIWKFREL